MGDGDVGEAEGVGVFEEFGALVVEGGGVLSGVGPDDADGGGGVFVERAIDGELAFGQRGVSRGAGGGT